MTQKNKELLLKDLCARLTCRTMVKCNTDGRHEFDEELSVMHIVNFYQFETKPYLRPMEDMTNKERQEMLIYSYWPSKESGYYNSWMIMSSTELADMRAAQKIDWLNAHHFDYRGLIKKGLALEAPEGMYN